MNICVFTSTRADFGILLPLLKEIQRRPQYSLGLFVTGTHFDEKHGYTYSEIEKNGFSAAYSVKLNMNESDGSHLTTFAQAIEGYAQALRSNRPDVAVVLGDRYEALAFAIVANSLGIPLCHLHGGEITEGALDDGYRHCITKLSYLHFTVSNECQSRVISMGENPERVFNVGALSMDNVKNFILLSLEQLVAELGPVLKNKFALMTYHPETMSPGVDQVQLPALLKNLERLIQQENFALVMTRSNADQGNSWIHEQMQKFADAYPDKVLYVTSVGNIKFLSLLKQAVVLVGNSSSGIFEAPAMGTPTVNVGDRQKGRERATSVIDVPLNAGAMEPAIAQALAEAVEMKTRIAGKNLSIFGQGNTATLIMNAIEKVKFNQFMKKDFYEKLA